MTILAAVIVILLSILIIYLTYKQYTQYPAPSCIYSPNIADNIEKPVESKRPFFTTALFHRRNDRPEERTN
jgi:hypothetical protein